jgi:hypothetical protein
MPRDAADGTVWLTAADIERLIDATETTTERIALTLAGQAGLRPAEIVAVERRDFVGAPDGFLRVRTDDTERLAAIPDGLTDTVQYTRAGTPGRRVVAEDAAAVEAWVSGAAARVADETGDDTWHAVTAADLRRSWAGHLLWVRGVAPLWVKTVGGWAWEPFERTFLGDISDAGRERGRAVACGDLEATDAPLCAPPTAAARVVYDSG